MYKTFIQVYRGSIHIQLEIRWTPDLAEALDAYVRFLNAPPFTHHHDKPKQAETTRQHINRLIRNILRESGLTPEGDLIVANMRLTPAQDIHCALEISQHRAAAISLRPSAPYRETTAPWPKPSSTCDIPHQIMRHGAPPEARASIRPGTTAWEEAANNLLLHALARAIATRQNIAINEQSFEAHLKKFSNTPTSEFYPDHNNIDLLQGAAEHLLIETVVAQCGTPD